MSTKKPTSKELAYLRSLANRMGETFTYPVTRSQASSEIRRLRQRTPSTRREQRSDTRRVQADLAERPDDACRIKPDIEVTGYGANATWR